MSKNKWEIFFTVMWIIHAIVWARLLFIYDNSFMYDNSVWFGVVTSIFAGSLIVSGYHFSKIREKKKRNVREAVKVFVSNKRLTMSDQSIKMAREHGRILNNVRKYTKEKND